MRECVRNCNHVVRLCLFWEQIQVAALDEASGFRNFLNFGTEMLAIA